MSGSRKCSCCRLHYVGANVAVCWFCTNGLDPRGPFGKQPKACGHCV